MHPDVSYAHMMTYRFFSGPSLTCVGLGRSVFSFVTQGVDSGQFFVTDAWQGQCRCMSVQPGFGEPSR